MYLRNKDKEQLLLIAKKTIKTPAEIWAYGSRVSGGAHRGSDLDLVVKTRDNQPLAMDELLNFKKHLSHSNIPILVQVVDWGRIPDDFKSNIKGNYQVLGRVKF